MNRRAFLIALAATTGAAAFPWLPAHEQPAVLAGIDKATFTWWRNRDPIYFRWCELVWDHERDQHAKMTAAFKACMTGGSMPD